MLDLDASLSALRFSPAVVATNRTCRGFSQVDSEQLAESDALSLGDAAELSEIPSSSEELEDSGVRGGKKLG